MSTLRDEIIKKAKETVERVTKRESVVNTKHLARSSYHCFRELQKAQHDAKVLTDITLFFLEEAEQSRKQLDIQGQKIETATDEFEVETR